MCRQLRAYLAAVPIAVPGFWGVIAGSVSGSPPSRLIVSRIVSSRLTNVAAAAVWDRSDREYAHTAKTSRCSPAGPATAWAEETLALAVVFRRMERRDRAVMSYLTASEATGQRL
jgi:hypothetical protein